MTTGPTRQQQVLDRLTEAAGEWVNGIDLANAEVGGSEGLKRLRELRAAGHDIEERRHPDTSRTVWQYRLRDKSIVSPLRKGAPPTPETPGCPKCGNSFSETRPTVAPSVMQGRCPSHGWQNFRA